jgi:4-aminobutyrate aminotransferase-like enzyme
MNKNQIITTLEKYEARSAHNQLPVVWDWAFGNKVGSKDKEYIDFTSGICVTNAGHFNIRIAEAIYNQVFVNNLIYSYNFPTEIRAKFLKELCEYTGFDKAFLVSAGTEAVEVAYKIIRCYGRKKEIAHFVGSFTGAMHGKTWIAECLRGSYEGEGIFHFDFPNNREKFYPPEIIGGDKFLGIIIESYQGWSGRFYPKQYIQDLVKWAKENKILVCFDEIQSGFGRTGKLFAYQHYDVEPDLICVGKGLTSSLPMSAVLGRKELLDYPDDLSSTQSGNPVCCAVGLANLKEIKKIICSNSYNKLCNYLQSFVRKEFKNYEVNGKGMVVAIITKTKEEADKIVWKAMKKGLLLIWTHRNSVKIAPPLSIDLQDLKKGLKILKGVIK